MKSEDIHVQIDEMEHGLNLFLLDKRQILDGSAICTSGRKLRSQTQVANYAKHYKCFA